MLHLLDETLEAFLRAEVPLPARDVDIAFAAPDRDWGAGVTKPTIDLFLWDVRRNVDERAAGVELVEEEGRRYRRQSLPRLDCRYLVTAWTAEVIDEHALLGDLLVALLGHREIAPDYLQGAYARVRPLPSLTVAAADGREQSDFWSALGGQLKPGLDVVVTATVDAAVLAAAGPDTERYEVVVGGLGAEPDRRRLHVAGRTPAAASARVRSGRGGGWVGAGGEFLVRAEPGDEVVVETSPPRSGQVGERGPVEFEE